LPSLMDPPNSNGGEQTAPRKWTPAPRCTRIVVDYRSSFTGSRTGTAGNQTRRGKYVEGMMGTSRRPPWDLGNSTPGNLSTGTSPGSPSHSRKNTWCRGVRWAEWVSALNWPRRPSVRPTQGRATARGLSSFYSKSIGSIEYWVKVAAFLPSQTTRIRGPHDYRLAEQGSNTGRDGTRRPAGR